MIIFDHISKQRSMLERFAENRKVVIINQHTSTLLRSNITKSVNCILRHLAVARITTRDGPLKR